MCVARLVLQEWHEEFESILFRSGLKEYLRGLYVDDGRKVVDLLSLGTRLTRGEKLFEYRDEWQQEDLENNLNRRDVTEVREAMNSINPDLVFTTETELDFDNGRLQTLSFQLWSEREGL